MSTYFFGGTIWASYGKTLDSLRIHDGKIVALNCDPEPEDERVDLLSSLIYGWTRPSTLRRP